MEHWNKIFFQGSLWLYILEVKAFHLEQLSCIVKIILWLLQNEWTQINYWNFALHYFYQLGLV